ncbi:UDP-N-acetylmuramate dehydrogenase [Patulibacter brassicae]|uniref:UDP-N-acetylenolpyruvoylglucosamine reductase n=1 Tax=Patulibacter brassicae TaxID=1705717 RepID=A0ABU4VNZ8_9ACTN|nr:UDP-N-acetylmuramate dehydrogenase [Patulibacter brassicae]MDX8153580.1 UDP-N-acetylmuramate dehydrogenase [Patulibacter brassicae]
MPRDAATPPVPGLPDAVAGRDVPLARLTTLGLGGPAERVLVARDEDALVDAVTDADREQRPLLLVGGGSNLVVADDPLPGDVVVVRTAGTTDVDGPERDGRPTVDRTVAAGASWDAVVASAVADGLAGIECLSGIPGATGATPIQNVGAYGQEVADTIVAVRVLDRRTGEVRELPAEACGFAYRDSAFKGRARYVVLAVTFRLPRDERSAPIRYAELAATLGVAVGERVPAAEARDAVLALRRGKGMVLDPGDPDTRSAGSFFTNPILDAEAFAALERRVAERLGADVAPPRHPAGDGRWKSSAAWLIDRAGFGRGHARPGAAISSKHALALTSRGGTTDDLLALAHEVADGVRAAFGVQLHPEPVLVGARWDADRDGRR